VATGPYVNFFIDKPKRISAVLGDIFKQKDKYGSAPVGKDKTVVIDYSQPNVGKPLGIHHLGSTVIGNSLAKIHAFLGFRCVRINYIGDWGTQFGVLLSAYKKWGDEKKLQADPVNYLLSLYVKHTAEEEKDPALHEEAKALFKKLEDGDPEATRLWKMFREYNIVALKKAYKRLDVEFDSFDGEAFVRDKMEPIIRKVQELGIAEEDQGMLIVRMEGDLPPCILKKSDEASTYALRDLASIRYRFDAFKPYRILYVVAQQQTLHFIQVFSVAKRLGFDTSKTKHVSFGMMRLPEGKMSTRKGKIIFMEDVLDRAVEDVAAVIQEKNPELKDKTRVAEQVGIGAVFFAYLMNDRVKDFEFSWDRMLDFEGDTGPYLQYTHARACSVLRKAKEAPAAGIKADVLQMPVEYELAKSLEQFPDIVASVLADYKPHILAQYLLRLGHSFNEFYHQCPIIAAENDDLRKARLLLCDCSRQVLATGLSLLGLAAPQEM
jgi:arginyl-tRNA synthetase